MGARACMPAITLNIVAKSLLKAIFSDLLEVLFYILTDKAKQQSNKGHYFEAAC